MEDQLFIIPIYLRSPVQYDQERRKKEQIEIRKYGNDQFGRTHRLDWPPWKYNDIIGYFEICVNSHKIISVTKYVIECKRKSRNPWNKRNHAIIIDSEFMNTPFYEKLTTYYSNQNINLKHRIAVILNEIDNEMKKGKHFIDIEYYRRFLKYLDINGFILSNSNK